MSCICLSGAISALYVLNIYIYQCIFSERLVSNESNLSFMSTHYYLWLVGCRCVLFAFTYLAPLLGTYVMRM